MKNDDLEDLTEHELLEVVVGELRALRRLIGAIFILGVLLSFVLPLSAAVFAN